MKVLVTGSAGHLGEALMLTLRRQGHAPLGIDVLPSAHTQVVGSIADRGLVAECMRGMDAVLHVATLHKPHVATHARQAFVDTNLTGTLNLLEEAVAAGVGAFVFASSTSVFGRALTPPAGAPAAWITEDVVPVPRNIYGVTKQAAENLCQLFQHKFGLPAVVLRLSRFFPEQDDQKAAREAYADANLKANELLFRRVDIEDAVSAHLLAIQRAPALGFGRYIISASTPFTREDLPQLRGDAAAVVERRVPAFASEYARRGWRMTPAIDCVYVNERARNELGFCPRHDFTSLLERLAAGGAFESPLCQEVGKKGYHGQPFADGPYPVEE